jgi:hypothetical protein
LEQREKILAISSPPKAGKSFNSRTGEVVACPINLPEACRRPKTATPLTELVGHFSWAK